MTPDEEAWVTALMSMLRKCPRCFALLMDEDADAHMATHERPHVHTWFPAPLNDNVSLCRCGAIRNDQER